MAYQYSGKRFLITGVAGGIGSAMAEHVAQRGGIVIGLDINNRRLERLITRLPGAGHKSYSLDLTDRAVVDQVVAKIEAELGYIDVQVNNVAMTSAERFDERSIESIDRELNINLLSPIYITHKVLPLLKRSSDPFLITTVSLGGIFPLGETPMYTTTKFALRGWMLSLAMDFKGKGIKVGSILPSATDTPMLRQEALDGGNSLQFMDPPQTPADVVKSFSKLLDRPRFEVYPKLSESWLVRVVMLAPDWIPRLLPLFKSRGDKGMRRYINSLVEQKLAKRNSSGKLELVEDDSEG